MDTGSNMPTAARPSYWCHNCSRLVRILSLDDDNNDGISCPYCDGGFVEAIESLNHTRQIPTVYVIAGTDATNHHSNLSRILRFHRNRRSAVDWSNINHIIALRGSGSGSGSGSDESESDNNNNNAFQLYHDDGSGSGLRPVPASLSESLMGSGFERVLEQLSQIEFAGFGQPGNPPASKSAIESMPTVEIGSNHVSSESHCAVCKEAFELGTQAQEMPCKHIFHEDCILPWLSLRNTCPVCRHQMPADDGPESGSGSTNTVGLSIWRLPGGVFAVGRFRGEREVQLVDGGFGDSGRGGRRRISWVGIRRREGRFRRVVRNLGSIFRLNGGGGLN